MTLEEAAARLVSIVGDPTGSGGPNPKHITIPFNDWLAFVEAFDAATAPQPEAEPPPEEPTDEPGDRDPAPHRRTHAHRGSRRG